MKFNYQLQVYSACSRSLVGPSGSEGGRPSGIGSGREMVAGLVRRVEVVLGVPDPGGVMIRAVRETMQPEYIASWVRPDTVSRD